jgi:hypothetical protein
MRMRQAAAVVTAAGAMSACGSSVPPAATAPANLPNIAQIESAIAGTILKADHVNARVVCPTQVPQLVGETFSCVAVARQPQPRTFIFQVTEHGGTLVTYALTGS